MKEKILVVDDDVMIRDMLYTLFTKYNYDVVTAPGGKEALEMLPEDKPDLIVLDMMMPGMNGLETLKRIREINREVEVIVLTSLPLADLEKQASKLGVSEIIRKGVSVELFLKSVKYYLDRCQAKGTCALPAKHIKGTIMVTDDDPEIRFMLETFLTKHGYGVISAANGEEAIQKLSTATTKPDLILLDVKMPGMDGIVTLKKIRSMDKKIGVVMITSVNDADVVQEAMKLGAYEYIMKPFNMEYLEMVVLTKILVGE
ncbi:MAG: response regulator [Planctomycetes bacterium]|nr:response regulator [Planctomycetota bacterium]